MAITIPPASANESRVETLTLPESFGSGDCADSSYEIPVCVDVMSPHQKREYRFFVSIWILASVGFSWWWFQPAHIAEACRFVINSMIIGWSMLIPAFFSSGPEEKDKSGPATAGRCGGGHGGHQSPPSEPLVTRTANA
jgi:hypothetical protein